LSWVDLEARMREVRKALRGHSNSDRSGRRGCKMGVGTSTWLIISDTSDTIVWLLGYYGDRMDRIYHDVYVHIVITWNSLIVVAN
jgi:hypothetical protein